MTPLPTEHLAPFGPTRAFVSFVLIVLATAVQVELCRAQMRDVVPEGLEVLSRGPVHEAFAGLQTFNPQPGHIVARLAPPLIEEVPPNQRPAGVNIAWIPGYWAWDDERLDFVWLSGTWRALPPGREWAAGYWAQVPAGYQSKHYYFGDYYAAGYSAGGFLSSSAFARGRFGHDPIHAHQVWEHRRDPGWPQRSEAAFRDRQDHPFHRPARAWTPAESVREVPVPNLGASGPLARPYNQLRQRDQSPPRYQTVTGPERTLLKTRTEDVERSRELRRVREASPPKASGAATTIPGPDRVRSLRSPIRSLPNRQLPGALAPPKAHRSPKPGSDPIPPGRSREDR
jgi:hypothetical protein